MINAKYHPRVNCSLWSFCVNDNLSTSLTLLESHSLMPIFNEYFIYL